MRNEKLEKMIIQGIEKLGFELVEINKCYLRFQKVKNAEETTANRLYYNNLIIELSGATYKDVETVNKFLQSIY